MYLIFESFDGKTIRLTAGGGPRLPGHYMNSSKWRIISWLLASFASAIPNAAIAIVAEIDPESMRTPASFPGGGEWTELSASDVLTPERGGWVALGSRKVLFLSNDRAAIEDCVYQTMASSRRCVVFPSHLRQSSGDLPTLAATCVADALVEVDGSYSDIDVIINADETVATTVVVRTARVVADFDQL